MSKQIKQCPYCAETIKAAAIICRFCNRELEKDSFPSKTANAEETLQKYAKHLAEKGWKIESMSNQQFVATKREPLNGIVAFVGFIGLLFYIIPGLLILLVGYVARGTETMVVTATEAQEWVEQKEKRAELARQRAKDSKAREEAKRIAEETRRKKKVKELEGSPLRFWYKMSVEERLIVGIAFLVIVLLAFLSFDFFGYF